MPTVNPSSLPWMIQFAFWASLILTIFKIGEVIFQATRSPRLDLQLTSDAFFRLSDQGESLFCNAVLLAWNGPILICDSRAVLEKIDSPTKEFPLKILEFGEKVKGAGPMPDHYFYSRSPLTHLAESDPKRALYFCVQERYVENSRRAISDFRNKILGYKQGVLARTPNATGEEREAIRQEILGNVTQFVDDGLLNMMELVQLEPGEYKLTLEMDYLNPKSRFFRKIRKSKSSIKLTVSPDVRETFRVNLRQALYLGANNLIFDQQAPITYPEYVPLQVKTLT